MYPKGTIPYSFTRLKGNNDSSMFKRTMSHCYPLVPPYPEEMSKPPLSTTISSKKTIVYNFYSSVLGLEYLFFRCKNHHSIPKKYYVEKYVVNLPAFQMIPCCH